MEEWNPDPKIIEILEQKIKGSELSTYRIAVGRRILNWDDVLEEVKTGTPFGRSYYEALVETLKR